MLYHRKKPPGEVTPSRTATVHRQRNIFSFQESEERIIQIDRLTLYVRKPDVSVVRYAVGNEAGSSRAPTKIVSVSAGLLSGQLRKHASNRPRTNHVNWSATQTRLPFGI